VAHEQPWRLVVALGYPPFVQEGDEDRYRLLAEQGIRYVEDMAPPLNRKEAQETWFYPRYLTLLEKTGLRVNSTHLFFGGEADISTLDSAKWKKAVETADAGVRHAAWVGAGYVVIHLSGEPVLPKERGQRMTAVVAALREVAALARKKGLKVAVEFLPRSCLGNSADELLAAIRACRAKNVGICLDLNHANLGQSLPENIAQCAPHLLGIHVSDNDGVDERHWMPYEGVIDWAAAMKALKAARFNGAFVYEAVPRLLQLYLRSRPGQKRTDADLRFEYLRMRQDYESLTALSDAPIA